MTEHKYTDEEVIKAFDILDKFEFFGGQRAGRELWFNKPTDIQNKDIGDFLRDLDFLKQFISRQKAEIERLKESICGIFNDLEDYHANGDYSDFYVLLSSSVDKLKKKYCVIDITHIDTLK